MRRTLINHLPSSTPSFAHCTIPLICSTTHFSIAVWPWMTLTSVGPTVMRCGSPDTASNNTTHQQQPKPSQNSCQTFTVQNCHRHNFGPQCALPRWLNWQGGRVTKVTELTGWLSYQGDWIDKVAVLPRWLNWQGGCIAKVTELTWWLHYQDYWIEKVAALPRWPNWHGGCITKITELKRWLYYQCGCSDKVAVLPRWLYRQRSCITKVTV